MGGPAAAHEQVEGQGPGKDVVVVELGRGHHPPPPARGPERWQIQPPEEEEPRLRLPQPGEQRRQRGLPAPRRPFQEEALPHPHLQTALLQDRSPASAMAKDQGVRLQQGRTTPIIQGLFWRHGIRGRGHHLWTCCRRKERGHLVPREHGTRQMPQTHRELSTGFIGQQRSAHADGHRDGRGAACHQRGHQTQQPHDEPATGDERREPRCRAV